MPEHRFTSRAEALPFLEAPYLAEHDFQGTPRKENGWKGPISVCDAAEYVGPKCLQTLREFYPIEEVGVIVKEPLKEIFRSALERRSVDCTCYLADDWLFDEIDLDAKKRSGHLFNVGKFISAGHVVLNALHELDDSFRKFRPNAPCRAVSDFWRSLQVHRHLAQFCDRLAESKTARDHYGTFKAEEEVKNAMTHSLRLLAAFAHEVGDGDLQSPAIDDKRDQFRLPSGMQSTGDPIDGNPFQETRLEHYLWNDATKLAEKELSLLNSILLSERPTPALGNFADWTIRLIVGKFDIWAKRYAHVVWSDQAVPAYGQWLFNYAEVWIELNRNTSPELVHVETFLNELRLKLMQRMEYWKALAYRQVAGLKEEQKAISEGWLRINSKLIDGAKLTECLTEAYDHHAMLGTKLAVETEKPLTEVMLNRGYPESVFRGAIHYNWITYPLVRPVGKGMSYDFFLTAYDHSHTNYELVPEQELTETFAGYRVTSGFERQFKQILASRIAHWRAEALSRTTEVNLSKQAQDVLEPKLRTNKTTGDASEAAQTEVHGRAANWQDIQITFHSDERLQIKVCGHLENFNYAEFGFEDSRNGKPNRAWLTLRLMAEQDGIIRNSSNPEKHWTKIEKRIQELRKALRKRFYLDTDPLPFVTGTGYKACFKISCSTSYNT